MESSLVVQLAVFALAGFGGVGAASADVIYSYTAIDVPGATNTQPFAINDSGQIVGTIFVSGTGYGFLDTGGRFTTIDVPHQPWYRTRHSEWTLFYGG